jgi:hypothetical protein
MLRSKFSRIAGVALAAALASCGGGGGDNGGLSPLPPTGGTKSVGHFFIIVLENKGYDSTFTASPPPSPYLATDLPAMGQLLTHYYGTGHASLDNYITMVSGQPPDPWTQADSPIFDNVVPGTTDPTGVLAPSDIVIGYYGSVYPASTMTVVDQLEAKGLTWRGYMQDMGADPTREAPTCGHPALGSQDNTESATPTDQYATRHDPFMYFHSIIDDQPRCDAHVVNLDALDADLALEATTPNYVFITPDLCADGHDAKCADTASPGGYDGIDAFLREWVPKITASPAFRHDGFLLITFDESDGNSTDGNDACCNEPTGPNTTQPGAGEATSDPTCLFTGCPGGGRVGAIVISPFTKPGSVNDTPYNHYSMLRSVEDFFGLDHLGYAAQDGLVPFGADVLNAPP